jgi:putative ABC transport system permease protein
MFKNYLLSLYRNIMRNKFYTSLNIIGLSLGIAVAIFILLYVQDELSYDKYNVNHERIYRIESDFTISNKHDLFAIVPIPMGPALKIEFPEIEEFVRFTGTEKKNIMKIVFISLIQQFLKYLLTNFFLEARKTV